jgi:Conserved mid region of cactin
MMVICKDRLDSISPDQRLGREAAAAVEADINAHLQGKSYDHLLALQRQIQAKLSGGGPVDIDYWEGLLKKLLVWKSKVRHTMILGGTTSSLALRQG